MRLDYYASSWVHHFAHPVRSVRFCANWKVRLFTLVSFLSFFPTFSLFLFSLGDTKAPQRRLLEAACPQGRESFHWSVSPRVLRDQLGELGELRQLRTLLRDDSAEGGAAGRRRSLFDGSIAAWRQCVFTVVVCNAHWASIGLQSAAVSALPASCSHRQRSTLSRSTSSQCTERRLFYQADNNDHCWRDKNTNNNEKRGHFLSQLLQRASRSRLNNCGQTAAHWSPFQGPSCRAFLWLCSPKEEPKVSSSSQKASQKGKERKWRFVRRRQRKVFALLGSGIAWIWDCLNLGLLESGLNLARRFKRKKFQMEIET